MRSFACTCATTGKRSYVTRADARSAARQLPDHMGTYRCDSCGYYHVGHVAPEIIRGITTRGESYGPLRHARQDDTEAETERLDRLRRARQRLATGTTRIPGVDRETALARVDAEIVRLSNTVAA